MIQGSLIRRFRGLFTAAAVVSVLAHSVAASADEKVSVRLRWLPQAQFAGYYVAKAKGFYTKNGLDVTINPGGPNITVETLVGSGADTFGVGGGPEAMLYARDKGLPLICVGMTLQQSPHVFVALKKSGITTLADFKGKKVSTWFTGAQYTLYAMLATQGIKPGDMTIVPQAATMTPFVDGEFQVATATRYNEFVTLQEQGVTDLTVFKPADFGVTAQADSIVTNEAFLKAHPAQVQAFLAATLEGWKYALQHKAEAIDIVMAAAPSANKPHQVAMLNQLDGLITAGKDGSKGIGRIDMDIVKTIQARLIKYDALKKPVDLNAAFDTSVWDKVPAEDKSL